MVDEMDKCIDCGEENKKLFGIRKGTPRCGRCYRSWRYHNVPGVKKGRQKANNKYRKKRYYEDPEYQRKVLKANYEYSRKRYNEDSEYRERVNAKRREYHRQNYVPRPPKRNKAMVILAEGVQNALEEGDEESILLDQNFLLSMGLTCSPKLKENIKDSKLSDKR